MALRWFEGFETVRLGVLLGRKYVATSTTDILGTVVGWQDKGFALDCQNSTGGVDLMTPVLVSPVANSWTMGWAWMMDTTSGLSNSQTQFPCVSLHDSVGQQLQFEMVAFNQTKAGGAAWRVQVRRGATVIATSDAVFTDQIWYYIEVKATIHPSTGSFEMRWWTRHSTSATVDTFGGATISGINTANQGTAGADRVRISLITAPVSALDPVNIDDIYIRDDSTYLGRQFVEGLLPSGDGVHLEWDLAGGAANVAAAWGEAATTQSAAGDDSRVTSDTTDERELAAYADLVNIRLATVNGLLLHTQHRMDTSGDRDFVPLLRRATGPAEFEGTTVNISSTAFSGSSEVFEEDPNTSSPWVIADINAYQFGVTNKS